MFAQDAQATLRGVVLKSGPDNTRREPPTGPVRRPSAITAEPGLKRLGLGAEPLVCLMSRQHPLAGDGPLAAHLLHGERIVLTGHRDGAAYDQTVTRMLADLNVEPFWIPSAPGPALRAAVADGTALALTTAPQKLHHELTARALAPTMTLPFELVWRPQACTPALGEFVRITQSCGERRLLTGGPLTAAA